jgi:hypothetical protein
LGGRFASVISVRHSLESLRTPMFHVEHVRVGSCDVSGGTLPLIPK